VLVLVFSVSCYASIIPQPGIAQRKRYAPSPLISVWWWHVSGAAT